MSNARRVADWRNADMVEWRGLVTRDLDGLDDDLRELGHGLRSDLTEMKEQQKWMLRTMWALLVALLMVAASIVAAVVVP